MPEQLSFPAAVQTHAVVPDFPRIVEVNDSTAISRLAYHPQEKRLRVWFSTSNTIWEYREVWPSAFAALASAYSVGEVFNKTIRDRYEAVRVAQAYDRTLPAKKPPHRHHG